MALPYFIVNEHEPIRLKKLNAVEGRVTALEAATGAVTSFNTRTGAVTLTSGDVTAALTYTPLRPSSNLSDVSNAATSRTNLGLATVASSGSAADLTGNLAVARLNSGTGASSLTFWRGDGTWVAAGSGSSGYTVVTKIAGYTETATSGELIIKADLAAGFTIVLPTAVGNTAKITVKKIQSAGTIVVDGNASETIDGGLTATLNNQYESITLVSDNANWNII